MDIRVVPLGAHGPGGCLSMRASEYHFIMDFPIDFTPLEDTQNMFRSWYTSTKSTWSSECDAKLSALAETGYCVKAPRYCHPRWASFWSDVDAVVISTLENALGLPYLMNNKFEPFFKGRLFMTEPLKRFLRLLLEDLVQQWEKLPQFHLLQEKKEKEEGNEYLPLYSLKDVHACLQRIETVSYDEWIELDRGCRIQAKSSGYSLGSCNWLFEIERYTIFYLGLSSLVSGRLADRLVLPHEPVDVLICQQAPRCTSSYEEQMKLLAEEVNGAVFENRAVLLPVLASPSTIDIIDSLYQLLNNKKTRILFITPVAQTLFDQIGVHMEWTSSIEPTLNRLKDFQRQTDCLINRQLGSDSFFKPTLSASGCVMVVGHPSLLFGDVRWLMSWFENRKALLVSVDPLNPISHAVDVHSINFRRVPVDPGLSNEEFQSVLNTLQPKHAIVSEAWKFASATSVYSISNLSNEIVISFNRGYIKGLLDVTSLENIFVEQSKALASDTFPVNFSIQLQPKNQFLVHCYEPQFI